MRGGVVSDVSDAVNDICSVRNLCGNRVEMSKVIRKRHVVIVFNESFSER
jgi:hypothetical protein